MSREFVCPQTGFIVKNINDNHSLESKQAFVNHLRNAKGPQLFARYYPAQKYIQNAQKSQLWFQKRSLLSPPTSQILIRDSKQQLFHGLNFASNNYLALANHQDIVQAGIEAARQFGVNSAGSPLAFGATKYYVQLKEQLDEHLGTKSVLFSSGWLAQFGVSKCLVKQWDHVIIDEHASAAFYDGAYWSTQKVSKSKHLDQKDLQSKLKQIRSKDNENAILFITQSLFAVDSQSPNLVNIQALTKKYNAFILLNMSHDLGVFGKSGKGIFEEQGLKDLSNIVIVGSGSKSLGVNFGFCTMLDQDLIFYIKYFCSTYMFTNAINPIQSNCGLAALRIVKSYQGAQLRDDVLEKSKYLRNKLNQKQLKVLGRISPFVCVRVGNQIQARLIVKILMQNEIHANLVQYPEVKVGEANIRLCLSPKHTYDQINRLIIALDFSFKQSRIIFEKLVNNNKNINKAKL